MAEVLEPQEAPDKIADAFPKASSRFRCVKPSGAQLDIKANAVRVSCHAAEKFVIIAADHLPQMAD
eukprot:scaffold448614_cov42-Prasinocladus_malaysianus.AAC.1